MAPSVISEIDQAEAQVSSAQNTRGVCGFPDALAVPPADNQCSVAATTRHIRGSSLLLVGRLLAVVLNFAVQILIVRYLSKTEFGAFAFALVLVSFAVSFATFGLDKSLARFVPLYHERGDWARMFGTILLAFGTAVGVAALIVAGVLGLHIWSGQTMFTDSLTLSLLAVLIFLVPVEAIDRLLGSLICVFAKPRALFFRRYLLGPGLKLTVVLLLVALGANAFFLTGGYLVGGLIGTAVYAVLLTKVLRKQGVLSQFRMRKIQVPAAEVYGFSAALFGSDMLSLMRGIVAVFLLGYFHSTLEVADLRAVLPIAGLNKVVLDSFQLLYLPSATRMFARDDTAGINRLYWRTAAWVALLSFPCLIACCSLAGPVTTLLLGDRYANAAPILAVLSVGYFFNAALGFNALTLKVYGQVRVIVANDVLGAVTLIGANLLLIPPYGAMGAAVATCATFVIHNLLNQAALLKAPGIEVFERRYIALYVTMATAAAVLLALQTTLAPPLYVSIGLALAVCIVVQWAFRDLLAIGNMFPELARFPLIRLLVGT